MPSLLRTNGVVRLTNRRLMQLQGVDAARFVQAILTNDMKHLTRRGDALYGGFLTTKGRVLGDCNVVQVADDAFLLDYDAEVAESLQKHWKRYKLRMKAKLEDKTDAYALFATLPASVGGADAAALPPPANALNELVALNPEEGTVTFADPRGEHFGVRAIVPVDSTCMYTFKELSDGIPLECNLDLLHGVSFRKGCYVGQELTARTQFKGNIRKRFVPVALVPADQQDVVKALSELAFKPFDSPSHGALRAYLSDSEGWKNGKAPKAGDKIMAAGDSKAVGTIVNVGQEVRSAIAMMRLGHLLPKEYDDVDDVPLMQFSTQDGAFHAVPFQPAWWSNLDTKTGKMVL
ncbi:hypothetical protein BBJ28_00003905 [Nothophytophthora sp. Chile5]|nr:hypothetical protein BBJ28_00003905 [Nothophytophthora sp. Chile5]